MGIWHIKILINGVFCVPILISHIISCLILAGRYNVVDQMIPVFSAQILYLVNEFH